MTLPYAFEKLPDGMIRLNTLQAVVIQRIYQRYIDGASLGIIAAELETTLIVKVLGGFIMGLIMEASNSIWPISADERLFLTTGIMGD